MDEKEPLSSQTDFLELCSFHSFSVLSIFVAFYLKKKKVTKTSQVRKRDTIFWEERKSRIGKVIFFYLIKVCSDILENWDLASGR